MCRFWSLNTLNEIFYFIWIFKTDLISCRTQSIWQLGFEALWLNTRLWIQKKVRLCTSSYLNPVAKSLVPVAGDFEQETIQLDTNWTNNYSQTNSYLSSLIQSKYWIISFDQLCINSQDFLNHFKCFPLFTKREM